MNCNNIHTCNNINNNNGNKNNLNDSLRESTFIDILNGQSSTNNNNNNNNNSSPKLSSSSSSPSSSSSSSKYIQNIINSNNNNEEINILLLGATGSGKSLFINSVINYLKYENLKDMLENSNNDSLATIPTIVTMKDSNRKLFKINLGDISDKEKERYEQRKSITSITKKYKIQIQNGKTINLIDTPGIGDTDGIETDKMNFEMILSEISTLSHLNAIGIFMKPDQNRMDALFKFCIQELLCHLHRDVKQNLFFCFTSSRHTMFRAGDTEQLLELVLNKIKESKGIEINLQDRMYFFDNECFNYVAVNNAGGIFNQMEQSTYSISWNQSVSSLIKLFKDIISTTPHDIQNTISINLVKKLIKEISQSISRCIQLSNENIQLSNLQKEKIQNSLSLGLEQLKSTLYIPFINIKSYPLNSRKIICKNQTCIKNEKDVETKDGQIKKLSYCCDFNGTSKLNFIYFSNGFNFLGICKNCSKDNKNCHFTSHLIIDTVEEIEDINVKDEIIGLQIESKESLIEAANQLINELEHRSSIYQSELEILESTSIDMSCFLLENSLIEFNDEIESYIQLLIENERMSLMTTSLPSSLLTSKTIENLENYLENHKKEVLQFKENLNKINNSQIIHSKSPSEIKHLINLIMSLEYSGQIISNICNSKKLTLDSTVLKNEIIIKIQNTRSLFNFLKKI